MNPIDILTDTAVLARYQAGELAITIDDPTWVAGAWADPYRRVSVPLVERLALLQPTANQFRVFYNPVMDEQHIWFTLGGDSYDIRWYKVFVVTRNSDGKQHYCGAYVSRVDTFFRTKFKLVTEWHH